MRLYEIARNVILGSDREFKEIHSSFNIHSWPRLRICRCLYAIILALFVLSACTSGLEDDYEEMYGYLADSSSKLAWQYLNPSIDYSEFTDSRDGQVYKTITIGSKTWMAENLNYNTSESYCYGGKASNCSKYGRLYTWSAAMNACPSGWHLPNDDEWGSLWRRTTGGLELKSTNGWHDGGDETDSFGFAILPAGYRAPDGNFFDEGEYAGFWSSGDYGYGASNWRFLNSNIYGNPEVDNMQVGSSVRCLRDSDKRTEASSSSIKSPEPAEGSSSSKANWVYLNPAISYGEFTDIRDGQEYKTVKIGTQTWMAENLNYRYVGVQYKYSDYIVDSTSWCYENKAYNCDKYGRLYTWAAAIDSVALANDKDDPQTCGNGRMGMMWCDRLEEEVLAVTPVQGICPEGWHLPSYAEWQTLFEKIGGENNAGKALKSRSGWESDGNGIDSYGFSALPAGSRNDGSWFFSWEKFVAGNIANFWSASQISGKCAEAYAVSLGYNIENVTSFNDDCYKGYGLSVRCLRNSDKRVEVSSSSIKSPEPAEGSSSSKANWAYLNPAISYGEFTDARDGRVYKTVKIGTQIWMAENLNYKIAGSFCYGDSASSNCSKYGRQYTWEVAMDKAECAFGNTCNASIKPTTPVRGVCPQGWHLPSHYEFEELINFIDPSFGYNHTYDAYSSTAGKYLKSLSGWNFSGNGTDAYGFSALPGGYKNSSSGVLYGLGSLACFWSSGEIGIDVAFDLELMSDDAYLNNAGKNDAESVRCLQD